ncbi:bifunctional RNase H/acid phosphatase [Streptomyces griseocarneus]|uniref:bifunctional RNase H/acid phosphatase n=1 Tax=Streptomyces griseocarneus TaxID=51201 RepID=UPI00167DFF16|nr:bifunctional RNase H/acid phosphatase [Streptomyces griseocarneus]MBZ6472153.1 bifunctional RNase H/acid phosphatase [Streptomyces griseocarneus]GHG73569.1 bifunctional RNase H/acid phosphatase [Streptomyces griseocarneus]
MANRFIVEADGGSRGNPGPAGYGAVVLDAATGEALAEAAAHIGTATNNVAEYKGLIAGLEAARALDPEAVVQVRMDSKLVVEQMSGRWKIKHPDMKPLAAQAQRVFPADRVTYEWIPREKNKHADRLANEAMDAAKAGRQWEPGASAAGLAVAARTAVPAAEPLEEPKAVPVGWGAAADLGAPTTFVLLRHGETALTPQKRFSGSGGTDPELSEAGRRQAEAVAAALAARGTIQAIVSSPMRRTRQTAEAVAKALGLEVRIDEGLREADFGAWEGLTFAEVKERHPEDLDAWLASSKAAPTGGGESFAAVARRMAVSRDKLLARYAGRTVLLVTHVTPVKTLVRLALGAPPESLFRMELSAASLSAVAYYADGNASVRLLNDTAHLR